MQQFAILGEFRSYSLVVLVFSLTHSLVVPCICCGVARLLAPSISRSVWDPTCANSTWEADSYGTDIGDRRQLPAYNYLPGWPDALEPA